MQTSDEMQHFTICQDKLHSFNIQDHRSTRGLLAKPFKKFPKSPIRPAGSHFWQAPNLSWTLKESRFNIIKNLLYLFFISWFYNYVILKSVWYARHFEYSCERCSWTTENKRQSDENCKRLLTINKRNSIRWNIYRNNNFHSRKQVLKCL